MVARAPIASTLLAIAALGVAGCYDGLGSGAGGDDAASTGADTQGGSSGGATTGGEPAACAEAELQDSPLRRLTRWEYDNTVADLLGDTTAPGTDFLPESLQLGFSNGAASTPMSASVVESYENAALVLAANAVVDLEKLLGCSPTEIGEDACAAEFIVRFGRRAFRRPLTADEQTALTDFYTTQKASFGFAKAIEMIVASVLQTPSFLYRVEFGMPEPEASGALRLSPYETASRLSYLLWGTMPDDALLDAAEAGELDDAASVRAWAQQMIDDPRGAAAIADFHVQWMKVGNTPNLHKNATEFTPEIGALMVEETRLFVDDVVRNGDGSLRTLLTEPSSMMNADLAAFYGIDGPTGDAFEPIDLDPTRASGLLTHGSLMASMAHEAQPSPVYRGRFVLEQLLCSPPPPPPDNVNTTLPTPDPAKTQREQLEELTANPPCIGCHASMNAIGFAFDHYDAVGRWRDDDRGLPLDTTGTISLGAFADHAALAGILADDEDVRACVVTQWFHYAYGRAEGELDSCSLDSLTTAFSASDGNVRTLLLELTQTPAFLYRTSLEGGQ